MGLFKKLFTNKNAEFQKRVIEALQSEQVQPGADSSRVLVGGIDLDLSDLYQRCMDLSPFNRCLEADGKEAFRNTGPSLRRSEIS